MKLWKRLRKAPKEEVVSKEPQTLVADHLKNSANIAEDECHFLKLRHHKRTISAQR